MNEHSRPSLEEYYREAATWNTDRVAAARSSRKIAWIVASGAALVALLEAIALIVLMPLKTVEPYTLLVDRNTGFVQGLKPLDAQQVTPDSALTQSFLVQYVNARESFDLSTLQANYRKAALFSADRARATYLRRMQASNPENPVNLYPRDSIVETRIKSVSPVGRDTAFVRFETVRTDANAQVQPPSPWVAVIRYRYTGEPMRLEDRLVNPLGFQVVHYRVDAEALPAAPATAVQAVQVPAAATSVTVAPAAPAQPYYSGPQR